MLAPDQAVSYGKAAIVGINGEQEHGNAMLTTVFGNVMREAVGGGKAWISSMTKRAAPGATIDVPLAHKDALYVRSHYDGMTLMLPDAPQPNEIAIIAVYATRGRPNHRVGGLAAAEIKGQSTGLVVTQRRQQSLNRERNMTVAKTGAEHIASLRDGRTVYIDGKLVADVTDPSGVPECGAVGGGAV